MVALTRSSASSRGSTPEMAKKQACRTVFVRPGSPASRATASASMANSRNRRSMISCCTGTGSESHTWSAGCGELSSSVAPSWAVDRTSTLSRRVKSWMPTNPALVTSHGAAMGTGPKRRCETVSPPDFFES